MKNTVKLCCFLLISSIFLCTFYQIFRRKMDESDTWKIYYEQNKNSIDVIVVGSSHTFGSINPAILYDKYGIASFVLGAPGLSIKGSYYSCVEALKTQSPKIIIVDITGYDKDEEIDSELEYTPLWIEGMSFSKNKYDMSKEIAGSNWLPLVLEYPVIHTRYDGDLDKRDFLPYRGDEYHKYYKGNRIFWNTTTEFLESDYPYIEDIGEISDITLEYLDKLIDLANEEETDIIFYVSPYFQEDWNQRGINAIGKYVGEKGATFLNLNSMRKRIGLDMEQDMADKEHVNHLGQEKTSAYLGAYIRDNYEIPDRRGNMEYESWALCAEDYHSVYNAYMLAHGCEDIGLYIHELITGDYTILIYAQGEEAVTGLKKKNILEPFSVEWSDDQEKLLILKKGNDFIDLKNNKYFDFGQHVVSIGDSGLLYDHIGIGFIQDSVSFAVFDNLQQSIVEYRCYCYDRTADKWSLELEDCWFQEIWSKR